MDQDWTASFSIRFRNGTCIIMLDYYILSSNKDIFVWPIWPEVNCPYFHTPGKYPVIGLLQDHFHIEAHIGLANMGLDFVSGQYGCLFSRCRKYVINSLIHGHFHIGLVIIPRPILARDGVKGPIWDPWDDNQANMEMPMY